MKALVHRLPKVFFYVLLAVVLTGAAVVLSLRYWLLPNVERYRGFIVAAVSEAAGTPITIGEIRANWDGLRPHLELDRLQIFDHDNNLTLELVRVGATLSWRSLLDRALRLRSLEIVQPALEIRRDRSGNVFAAGMLLSEEKTGGGLRDLILQTRSVSVSGAVLSWEDELRGAPPLVMDEVSLNLENRGSHHRFGVHARPPAHLAGRLDVRGDVRADRFADNPNWAGAFYAELPYIDGGVLQRYVALPKTFMAGHGALRLWVDFHGGKVESAVADLHFADTVARLQENLPQLDLTSLSGRIRYQAVGEGFKVIAEKLSLATRDEVRLAATDFLWRSEPKQKNKAAEGELRANQLDLSVWAALVEHLPIEKAFKQRVSEFAPSGRARDLSYRWTGEASAPATYSLTGKIEQGAVKAVDAYPGFAGAVGSIEADEQGGAVSIESLSKLHLPELLAAPVPIDRFVVKAKWQRHGAETAIQLSQAAFANGDLAGSATGTYRAIPGQRGIIDLSARLERLEGSHLPLYLPSMIKPTARAWLEHAIVQAKSNDVALRLRGDLKNFPFADEKNGQFLLTMKLTDGVLDYAEGWPRIENIHAQLTFRGHGMEIKASHANIFGAKLNNVVAGIAELNAADPWLRVHGEASGPLVDKLRFVNDSPVKKMIGGITEGMRGAGSGKLVLKLAIPLHQLDATRVAGDYHFNDASAVIGADSPPITEINGRLQFTEHGVQARNIAAKMLGGPIHVSVSTAKDGEVAVEARGTASISALRNFDRQPLLRHVSGAADWQAQISLQNGRAAWTLTSPLTGVTIALPAPFKKTAGKEMPLTVERKPLSGQAEIIRASLGETIFAALERGRAAGSEYSLRRGMVSFGGPAILPAQAGGLWFTGKLAALDVDDWRAALKIPDEAGGGSDDADIFISGADLSLGSLGIFDRSFTDIHFIARAEAGGWQGSVSGPQVAGTFSWQSAGKGLVQARLKRLQIPDEKPHSAAEAQAASATTTDFPALDIIAEATEVKGKDLGRLLLKAEPQGRDWRIERLELTQDDAALQGSGVWLRGPQPQTVLKLDLATADAGKLLDRLGYPDTMRRGKAQLIGNLSWPGAPYEMLPAKLSGQLQVNAQAGQFLQAEPGAGRLLGLISLQSLPRRISLDFRDIFSKGFAFDSIRGTVQIRRGVMNTEDFAIAGPAGKVAMAGEVSLVHETQQLHVKVMPTLGEGIALASGLLGGPAVGLTAFLLQKLLEDPISRAVGYEYSVSGTWDNPNVVKVTPKQLGDETKQP